MSDFMHNIAAIIGIEYCSNGIHRSTTPVNDAMPRAQFLADDHGYDVRLMVEDVTKARLERFFAEDLPPQLDDDRLLVYFAGHGVALDGFDSLQLPALDAVGQRAALVSVPGAQEPECPASTSFSSTRRPRSSPSSCRLP